MEEKDISALQTPKDESAEIITEEKTVPKKKKQIALKIISTILYLAITITALVFEITFVVESATLLATPDLGLEGLAFVILLPALIIVPIASLILYLIPFIMSAVGFGISFKKTKKGAKRKGKIYFGILIALIIVSEAILIIGSVATILAVKFCQ